MKIIKYQHSVSFIHSSQVCFTVSKQILSIKNNKIIYSGSSNLRLKKGTLLMHLKSKYQLVSSFNISTLMLDNVSKRFVL